MTTRPILVGVDGSAESIRAAEIAGLLARALKQECRYVYAAPELWPPGLAPLAMLPGMYDGVRDQLLAALRERESDVAASALTVHTGRAGDVLAREARRQRASLVVVGGRRHGALTRGLGGSTAHYLARALDVPLLAVSPVSGPLRRLLVAVDLSPAGATTLETAVQYASSLGAELRALHVVEPVRFPGVLPLPIDEAEIERRSRAELERVLTGAGSRLDRLVVRGVAPEAIAEAAAAWEADLIVVGSHGKGWVNRMLIGSTTERLLNLLPASVLVVPIKRVARSRARTPGRRQRREVVVV